MIPEERTLLPQESLALIAEAIRKTKENFRENSRFFLLWGWLIAAASLGFFLLRQYTETRFFFLPFPVLATAGIVTTLVWYRQLRAASPTETYLGYFINRLWMVVGDRCGYRDDGLGAGDGRRISGSGLSIEIST